MSSILTQYISKTEVDQKRDKYGFEAEYLRNKNLVVVLVLVAIVKSKAP